MLALLPAAQLLVYLWSVPVHLAFYVRLEGGLRLGAGLAAFDPAAAMRRAQKRPSGRTEGGGPDWRRVARVLARLRLMHAALAGSVCLGDAALTALAAGGLAALARCAFARAGHSRVALRPNFDSGAARVVLRGMVSATSGQIILALLRAGSVR